MTRSFRYPRHSPQNHFIVKHHKNFLVRKMESSSSQKFKYIPHERACPISLEDVEGNVVVLRCGHIIYGKFQQNWTRSNGGVVVLNLEDPVASNVEKCSTCLESIVVHKTYANYVNFKRNNDM